MIRKWLLVLFGFPLVQVVVQVFSIRGVHDAWTLMTTSDDLVASSESDTTSSSVLVGLDSSVHPGVLLTCMCDDSFAKAYQNGGVNETFTRPADEKLSSPEYLAQTSQQLGINLKLANAQGYQEWKRPGPLQSYRGTFPYIKAGYDPVCCATDTFASRDNAWFRDHLVSQNCRTQPRERALAFVLANLLPQFRQATKIHESSPNSFGSSKALKQMFGSDRYVSSQYAPNIKCGEPIPGRNNGDISLDLEHQHCIPDNSFDIVVSQDVFEHIYNPEAAFGEIARTLKPGGFHILTVPITSKQFGTYRAAQRDDSAQVKLYIPPEIHGNPMEKGGSLLTTQWGYDITQVIQHASGMQTSVIYVDSEALGIVDAEYREVLVSRKAGVNDAFPDLWNKLDSMSCDMITCTTSEASDDVSIK